jgi:hypothetical protein
VFPLILTFSRREKEQPLADFGNADVYEQNPTLRLQEAGCVSPLLAGERRGEGRNTGRVGDRRSEGNAS